MPADRIKGRKGRLVSSMLVAALVSMVLLGRAQLVESSFEEPLTPSWEGPEGGGASGGQGRGAVVEASATNFVRTGRRSVQLVVWDDADANSMSWAGLTKVMPCLPSRRVRVGAWLYFSSSVLPVGGETCAQLKIEYFDDEDAQRILPTHVFLSAPFNPRTHRTDSWHFVEAFDRAPPHACRLRFSIVMTARRLGGREQAVWVDDMFVDVGRPSPRIPPRAEGETPQLACR